MPEQNDSIRPTKKQRELLGFIESFIADHGYSPSYREIMRGLNYNSVATVALHVNSLIGRGHLIKRGRSARSLELRKSSGQATTSSSPTSSEEAWLTNRIEMFVKALESEKTVDSVKLDEAYVLVNTLKILGFNEAARSFIPRLTALRDRIG